MTNVLKISLFAILKIVSQCVNWLGLQFYCCRETNSCGGWEIQNMFETKALNMVQYSSKLHVFNMFFHYLLFVQSYCLYFNER